MGFISIIFIICIVVVFIVIGDLKKEIKYLHSFFGKLNDEINALKKELEKIKLTGIEAKPESEKIEIKKPELNPVFIPIEEMKTDTSKEIKLHPIEIRKPIDESKIEEKKPVDETNLARSIDIERTKVDLIQAQERSISPQLAKEIEKKPSDFSILLNKLEKQFADNWTGILGTGIMVLGIGYLSIYTALKVSPLFRVLILWFYAGILIGSYYLLKKKEQWEKTGLWLRSAGASLFLFGCFGASQVEELTFISSTLFGYLLIVFGIGINLYVGYIIKKQTFLSLHVILSMLILCVIPDKLLITFLLASITCTIGIVLSFKEKWEYHLLAVIVAFIIFDVWFTLQGNTLSKTENVFAIIGIISVATSCIIMQYRSVYNDTKFDKAGFTTHLVNWVLFASGLILHSTGNRFKTILLFVGAIVCFFMAMYARKKKVVWLYHLDGMVSFILLSLSIILLNEWNVGVDLIASILYIITLFILVVLHREKEVLLHKIFLGINHFMVLALFILSINIHYFNTSFPLLSLFILLLCGLFMAVFGIWKKELNGVDAFFSQQKLSLNGLFSLAISVLIFINWKFTFGVSFFYVLLILGFVWSILNQKLISYTFDIGRVFYLLATITLGIVLIYSNPESFSDLFFFFGICIVFYFNWKDKIFSNTDFIIRFSIIFGSNLLLLNLAYKYLNDHQIGFIFALLGLALLNFEFLLWHFKQKSLDVVNQRVLFIGYYFNIILASLFLVFNSYYLTTFEIGYLFVALTIVELYVLFSNRIRLQNENEIATWHKLPFINVELILFNCIIFSFNCLTIEYVSVFLATVSVILFFGSQKFIEFKKYHHYSFVLLLFSAFLTFYCTVSELSESNKFVIYGTQSATILISFLYSYFQFKSTDEKPKEFQIPLYYIQNLWIIGLLFIEVKTSYLSILFMMMALLNHYVISKEKIKINPDFISVIGTISICISLFFCINNFHAFETIDWFLQLGSFVIAVLLSILLNKKESTSTVLNSNHQIVLNGWISMIMFTQLEHKWLPVFWSLAAILNLFFYYKKIAIHKKTSIVYYFLANLHLAFISFNYYELKFLPIYLLIFLLLAVYVYLAYRWTEDYEHKNSLLIYPITLSIGCFLYLSFDKGILTFFWILEALGLLILGIILKEKYFRYVSLSLVGLCIVRLVFFDLSNADFLIRALVLLGVGIVLLVMNSLFKKYKDRFE